MPEARIGCSGWNYPHWRELFYPRGLPASRWLEHYSRTFDTVEVNATFYRLPTRKSAARWVEETPDGFTFSVKASRYLTHIKRLRGLAGSLGRLLEPLEPLAEAGKLGPILWQLPETFHRDDDRLAEALDAVPAGQHCFEFRHESWFAPDVERLLREHDAALVIGDHPHRRFQTRSLTANWTYLRFHQGRARDGAYGDTALRTWARRIEDWQRQVDVYAYFNDDWGGHALREAIRLRELLARHADAAAVL
jgi:uncharacterized protein YecE (DUF72 family)